MPEFPEVALYLHALRTRVVGERLLRLRIASPAVLKSVDPPPAAVAGCTVLGLDHIGKRIVIELEDELFIVVHLMIAGRFQWKPASAPIPRRLGHAAFDFDAGTLLLTEAGTRKRAQLHIVRGRESLAAFDRGGLDPLASELPEFAAALRAENRTLKRALTDPRILSGIGNAHSDEILLEARLSPLTLTGSLSDGEIERLYTVARRSLRAWAERLIDEAGSTFPSKVTAFHPAMMAHGKYGEPCPQCGTTIQRIVFAANETNYCPKCQTGGKLLADRAISRLLREDWPKSLDELDEHLAERRGGA